MSANDPTELNKKRVNWAQTALDAFREVTRCDPGEESLRDLLTDLRHWANRSGICWEDSLASAMRSYRAEVHDN